MLRLSDDRVIAPTPGELRIAACTLIERGRPHRLLGCSVADTHAHAVLLCSRAAAGQFAGRGASALRYAMRLAVPFEPASIRPIRDQRHLANAFDYVLRQEQRHGIARDGFHEGSNLPDLVGLRVVGHDCAKLLRQYLPRTSQASLLRKFDVDWATPVAFDPRLLLDAALATFGMTSLSGRAPATIAARATAIAAAGKQMSADELASLFGIDVRTVFRMRATPRDPKAVRAVQLQLQLRALLRSSPGQPNGQ